MPKTFDLDDVLALEEGCDDEETHFLALQRAINSLHAWRMQGSMGRAMMDAIKSGRCMLGTRDTRDYWGNHIPSRDQVQAGSKGSYQFVVDQHGEAWAKMMEGA